MFNIDHPSPSNTAVSKDVHQYVHPSVRLSTAPADPHQYSQCRRRRLLAGSTDLLEVTSERASWGWNQI